MKIQEIFVQSQLINKSTVQITKFCIFSHIKKQFLQNKENHHSNNNLDVVISDILNEIKIHISVVLELERRSITDNVTDYQA